MKPETLKYLKKAAFSYFRAAAAAVAALLLAGMDDPTVITVSALVGGLLGPIVRALDPNDDAYGIGAAIEQAHDSATSDAKKKKDVVE